MSIEKFTKTEVNKSALGLSGEVYHAPGVRPAPDRQTPPAERSIITDSDSHRREELESALSMMMNRIDMPMSVLEELADDEARKDKMNILAQEYVVAVKSLDTKKQKELADALIVVLG